MRSHRVLVVGAALVALVGVSFAGRGRVARDTPAIEPRGSVDSASVDSTSTRDADSSTSASLASAPRALRAAYVAARQAEADERYAFRSDGDRLVADNPGQRFSVRIDRRGLEVTAPGLEAKLRPTAVRCDARVDSIAEGAPAMASRRAEIDRVAGETRLVEWFENGPLGVEHGFDVDARCDSTFSIELALDGAEPSASGDGVRFVSADGATALRYTDLFVVDASGRELASRFDVRDGTIVASVDVRDAEWPIAIDPLVGVELTEVGPQPEANPGDGYWADEFGHSVAVDVDLAVIGVPRDDVGSVVDQGSAYVFVRGVGNAWTLQTKLTADDGATDDRFGYSVAIGGTTVLVGAHQHDVGSNSNQGAAYAFVSVAGVWSQQARLVAPDGATDDSFGISVAVSGDTAVVGASADDVGPNGDQGTAHVFVRSAGVWSRQTPLNHALGAANDRFGESVAIDGNSVIVGSSGRDVGGNADQGAAFVFVRVGSAWGQQTALSAAGGLVDDHFGVAVHIDGDVAVVGAPDDDVGASVDQGSVFFFTRSMGTWSAPVALTPAASAPSARFGAAVSVGGQYLVVGAPGYDVPGSVDVGATYVYSTASGSPQNPQVQLAPVAGEGENFGRSVSVSGARWLVGAPLTNTAPPGDQGAVYFTDAGSQFRATAGEGTGGDFFGHSVAIDGNTAIVGVLGDIVGPNDDQGSAYVFVRNGTAWDLQARLYASDGAVVDNFGFSVAIDGNTVAVGARTAGSADQGAVYVFTRSGVSWSEQAKLMASDGELSDYFGNSVAIRGGKIVVGAPFWDATSDPANNRGIAYLFTWNGLNWVESTTKFQPSDGVGGDIFGVEVAFDGTTAVIAARTADVSSNTDQGSVYAWAWDGLSWSFQGRLLADDGMLGDHFGSNVAVDGDTIVIGARLDDVGTNVDQGSAYVFVRNGSSWSQQTRLVAPDGSANDWFGFDVAIAGDRVLVTASLDDVGPNLDQGSVNGFSRTAGVWSSVGDFAVPDARAGDGLAVIATSGSSVIAGARTTDGPAPYGNPDEGRAYLFEVAVSTGSACSSNFPCETGFCVDGVCCESACGDGADDCMACASSATGQADGVCAPLASTMCGADGGVGAPIARPTVGLCETSNGRASITSVAVLALAALVLRARRRRRSIGIAFGMLAFVLAVSGSARAQGDSTDPEAVARAHFQLGTALIAEGRLVDAAHAFEAAYEASHRPALLFNVFVAYRDAGHYDEAEAALRRYMEADPSADTPLNRERLESLHRENETRRMIASEAASSESSGEDAARTSDSATTPASPADDDRAPSHALAYGLIGGGATVAVTGMLIGGLRLRAKNEQLDRYCGASVGLPSNQCVDDPGVADATSHQPGLRALAWGSLAVGVGAAATGVVLRLLGRDHEDARASATAACTREGCVVGAFGAF